VLYPTCTTLFLSVKNGFKISTLYYIFRSASKTLEMPFQCTNNKKIRVAYHRTFLIWSTSPPPPFPTFWDGLTLLASRVIGGLAPPGLLLPPSVQKSWLRLWFIMVRAARFWSFWRRFDCVSPNTSHTSQLAICKLRANNRIIHKDKCIFLNKLFYFTKCRYPGCYNYWSRFNWQKLLWFLSQWIYKYDGKVNK
jgi:hypothetical protein